VERAARHDQEEHEALALRSPQPAESRLDALSADLFLAACFAGRDPAAGYNTWSCYAERIRPQPFQRPDRLPRPRGYSKQPVRPLQQMTGSPRMQRHRLWAGRQDFVSGCEPASSGIQRALQVIAGPNASSAGSGSGMRASISAMPEP
jgi:hypothetical protein